MPCPFCDRTFAGDLVFEDDLSLVIVHDDWAVRGHLMVAAKKHVENASGLTSEEWSRLASLFRRVERVVLEATGADRAILLKLGIQVPHLHLHLYPVRASHTRADVMDMIDGNVRVGRDRAFVEKLRAELAP